MYPVMTKTQAIAELESTYADLSTEQVDALAALAKAWSRPNIAEDAATLVAIQEGLRQAEARQFVAPADVAELLDKPWSRDAGRSS
jgi:predicted transcriptional regulator